MRRSREDIEEEIEHKCGYECEKLNLEVLLDIRDLLNEILNKMKGEKKK